MKKSFVLIFGILIFMSLVASILSSYESNLFTISGYVFDSSRNLLADVSIELEDETIWFEDTTNENGYFEFINLSRGPYKLYINEKEVTDCGVRNEMYCQDISDRAVCENSYANYCSQPGYPYCYLPEGQCGYFPCFWGDVGEGYEACYSSCDQCAFGVNQSILESYTSIDFEDENIINLTDDLEINTTLLKIDAKLELNSSVFKNGDIIKANVTVKNNEAFNLTNWWAVFGVQSENDENEELYLNLTPTNLLAGQTKSFAFTYKIPENNTYDGLDLFGGTGNLNWSVPSSQGILTALTYKVDDKDIRIETENDIDGDGINNTIDNCPYDYNPGQEDSDGNGIGDVCELSIAISGYVFDSSGNPLASVPIELEDETIWLKDKTNSIGYFEFSNLAKGFYELYINEEEEIIDCSARDEVSNCHALNDRTDCENSYANYSSTCGLPEGEYGFFPCFWGDVGEGKEACYYSCDQCAFGVNQSISKILNYTSIEFKDENIINLTDDLEINATLLRINASLKLDKYTFRNGDTIKANVTVKNNENFDLRDWFAAFGIQFYNETYDEEIYFNITPTNLSAKETKSFIFNFKIPENNSYDKLYVYGGLGKMDWKVMSNQGNLFALTYKIDEKEITQIIKLQGDVNGDCKVNIFDLAKVGLCYGCSSAQTCWTNCKQADVREDNKIDIFDLATVGLNYGKSC